MQQILLISILIIGVNLHTKAQKMEPSFIQIVKTQKNDLPITPPHIDWNKKSQLKNSQSVISLLDSIHSTLYDLETQITSDYRTYYLYNDQQDVTSFRYLIREPQNQQFRKDCEGLYTYDYSNKQVTMIESKYEESNTEPIEQFKHITSYNSFDSISEEKTSTWDFDYSDFYESSATTFNYNENQRLQTKETLRKYEFNGNWYKSGKQEYSYIEGLIDTLTEYYGVISSSQWIPKNKRTFNYNPDLNLNEETSYTYSGDEWVPSYKFSYIYNQNNKVSQKDYFMYSQTANDNWEHKGNYEYFYDQNDSLTEILGRTWFSSLNQWVWSERSNVYYDNNGHFIEQTFELWDYLSNTWFLIFKTEMEFEFSPYNSNIHIPYASNGYMILNEIIKINTLDLYTYNMGGNTSDYHDHLDFYYTDHGTPDKIIESDNENFQLFPNPTQDFVKVVSKDADFSGKCMVMDINGRILITTEIQNNQKLDLTGLTKGMYFVEIMDSKGNKSTSKVVKN